MAVNVGLQMMILLTVVEKPNKNGLLGVSGSNIPFFLYGCWKVCQFSGNCTEIDKQLFNA